MPKPPCTRIVLSGTESDRFLDTAYNFAACRDMLVSYLYVKNKGSLWFDNRCRKYPDISWMIDSGAHSFRSEGYCEKWPDLAWFEDYVRAYRDWILTNKDRVSLVVNLDIDNVVGMGKMLEWDHEVFRPMEREGVPVCYVWHQQYGFDYWLQMCREHEYVGLPGNLEEAEWHKMMRPAMMNGCRVHGFAATKGFILGKVPLATADSISWKSGEMYGQTFVFENGALRVYDKDQKDERKRYKAQWVAAGVDWDALEQDKAEAITQVCALAWKDYQSHVSNVTPKLAYWLKTTKAFDELGDPKSLSKSEIDQFLAEAKFPYRPTSEDDAKDTLKTLRAFCGRDNTYIFALSDEDIDALLKKFGVEAENDTRTEKEAALRQWMLPFFYKLNPETYKGRSTEEEVAPTKYSALRDEPIRPYPGVEVPLPKLTDDQEDEGSSSEAFLLAHATETTPDQPLLVEAQPTVSDPTTAPEGPSTGGTARDQVQPDKGFTFSIKDPILRAKASLGVDLLFEQNKLRHEAETLRKAKTLIKRQKALQQQVRQIASEVSPISDAVGPEMAAKMVEAAQAAFDQWMDSGGEKAAEEALKKRALAIRPQNQLTPERAREIGKLGGAPKGNQNARKHGLYSPRMPNLACDNCPHIQVCDKYRPGHVCAYINEFQGAAAESTDPEVRMLEDTVQAAAIRLRRGLLFETFEGGIPSREVTKMMAQFGNLTRMLHDIKEARKAPRPQTPGTPAPAGDAPRKSSVLEMLLGGKSVSDAEFTTAPAASDG